MTTKSHYYFSSYLFRNYIPSGTVSEYAAFLLGCVWPDMNLMTYLNGSLYGRWFRGHDYQNMLPYVWSLFERTKTGSATGFLFYYRVGKIVHYLTDACTYPHNTLFEGNMRAHTKYEKELERHFKKVLAAPAPRPKMWKKDALYIKFLLRHKAYLEEKPGVVTDIRFTMEVVPAVMRSLCPENPVLLAETSQRMHKKD